MPIELARCPECGAQIGGQYHEAVQGVTRAENME
jgi:DNA-directed RNA polymerase subunit N (RpoN/RPB10)